MLNRFLNVIALMAITMIFTTCSDSGGPPTGPPDPPEPEMVEVTIDPTHADTTVTSARLFDTGSGEQIGTGKTTLTKEAGTNLSLRVEARHFETTTTSIPFNGDGTEEIVLEQMQVTIVFQPLSLESGELLDEAEVYADGELLGRGEVEITRGSGTVLELVIEAQFYHSDSTTIRFSSDDTKTYALERKQVTVSVSTTGVNLADYAGTVEVYVDDEFVGEMNWTTGPVTFTRPMSDDELRVRARAIYYPYITSTDRSDWRNVAEGEETITLTEDRSLELELLDTPDCSDGIDNNADGEQDEEELGCVGDDAQTYDPEDNNEVLNGVTLEFFGFQGSLFVSSSEGHRQKSLGDQGGFKFPRSIQYAVEIDMGIDVKIESAQEGEDFALTFSCGSSGGPYNDAHTTDIVVDDSTIDGWYFAIVDGVTKTFFSAGRFCTIYGVHASKVRNQAPGDGDDDVVFQSENYGERVVVSWQYESEDVPDEEDGA